MKQQILQISFLLTCIFVAKLAAKIVEVEENEIQNEVESQVWGALKTIGEVDNNAKDWARKKAHKRILGLPVKYYVVDNTTWSSLYLDLEVQIPADKPEGTKRIIESMAFRAYINIGEQVKQVPNEYDNTINAVGVAVSKQETVLVNGTNVKKFNIAVCLAIPASEWTKAVNVWKNTEIFKYVRSVLFIPATRKAPVAATKPYVVDAQSSSLSPPTGAELAGAPGASSNTT